MFIVHGLLLLAGLVIASRLIELQILRGAEYHEMAQEQHFGGVVLPAKRGEVFGRNSKTGEVTILATNTTLDLVYVDPLVTDNPTLVAETLSEALLTNKYHEMCSKGSSECPRELISLYSSAFDPMLIFERISTGSLLEPLPDDLSFSISEDEFDIVEIRRQFARKIEKRISEDRVTFVPLKYGATKLQLSTVDSLNIQGIHVGMISKLIYANPEQIEQNKISSISRQLAMPLEIDPKALKHMLRGRFLRYVPIMRSLPPSLSVRLREIKQLSSQETLELKSKAPDTLTAQAITDPLRSIALIPEHWRFYPDGTIASHVVGFLNSNQEAQYGIERTFDPQLRGQEGLIRTVSDPQGGQILTAEQRIIDPKNGDSVVLTIDRTIQREVERIMDEAVKEYEADSGQAIVMEPETGRILAMVNAPIFNRNDYGDVYRQIPMILDENKQKEIVVELYHPQSHQFIIRSYLNVLFTDEGRKTLSDQKRSELNEIEILYDLEDIIRYYIYIGENSRREIFPTDRKDIWLKYENNIGVGAYLNRNIQEIYEPGSVLKSVTMAVAIDQGEVTPSDTYDDNEPVEVDEYTIRNALNKHFGTVTMTQCLEFSVNTCMTSVSEKLGRKLYHRMLSRFGLGRITGIELEDELPGEILPWKKWSRALLATSAYGQGISATPLQVVTAYAALANGGKLFRPTIIDSIIKSDGTIEKTMPHIVDQVITRETSDTISSMLVSGVEQGFARPARVAGYKLAGKTGTSQIAGPGGKYETGTGSHITSFGGYGPIHNPVFVLLVKFDRPRTVEYGSESAAPVFHEIAEFILKYYGVPPDTE
ncbi:MAG: penicillin-binding protein 2 [Candidatus Peribacteraceae bacterium]|nr:penicillin-binding protein 2 [Candidatus Peribacteraceae bacterium]